MSLSDEELDRDWKPSGRRPQSTIAKSFSAELSNIFQIDNSIADLDDQVNKRKQQVDSHTAELEALEARIREMEARLKGQFAPASSSSPRPAGGSPRASRQPATHPFGSTSPDAPPPPPDKDYPVGRHQQQHHQKYGGSRPGTARQSQQAVPGALPPTPVGSEDGDRDRVRDA